MRFAARPRPFVRALTTAAFIAVAWAAPARASYPGANGRILVGILTSSPFARSVLTFDREGKPLGALAREKGRLQTVAMSADGKRIVGRYYRSGLAAPVLPEDGVYIGTIDGTDFSRLPVRPDDHPSFLPDGRVLLLRYNSSTGLKELWTVAANGTGLAQIPGIALATGVSDVVVAPDGTAIFYVEPGNSFTSVPDRLWRHELATNQRTMLHSRPLVSFPMQVADVSPDGKTVLFQEQADGTVGGGGGSPPPFVLRSIGARGGTPRTLSPGRAYASFSPDGRLISYLGASGQVRAMAPDGTGDRLLVRLRLLAGDVVTSVTWQPLKRVVISGVVTGATTAASTLRAARAATVVATGAQGTFSAPIGTGGRFQLAVEPGTYRLAVRGRSGCIVLAGRCATAQQIDATRDVRVTLLADPPRTRLALGLAPGARLAATRNRIAIPVRCVARTTCRGTVRLRKGRLAVASASVTVKAGKAKTVMLRVGTRRGAMTARATAGGTTTSVAIRIR